MTSDELQEIYEGMLSGLTDRERDILELRYIEGKKLREIGQEYDICGQRARQIIQKAIRKILKSRYVPDLLSVDSSLTERNK